MYRILVKCGQDVMSITPLTSRILRRAGKSLELIKQPDFDKPERNEINRVSWVEPVATKQQVLENWKSWSGDEIIEQLQHLQNVTNADVSKSDLDQTLDIWLLRALAQEKSLYVELKEIEQTYHYCRHLGKWNAVLVRNNLAVLKARRKDCLGALTLLTEAIQLSLVDQPNSRNPFFSQAPFCNAALIFHRLQHAGLLSDDRYRELLEKIDSLIKKHLNRNTNGNGDQPDQNHNFEPVAAYRRIAQHGYDLAQGVKALADTSAKPADVSRGNITHDQDNNSYLTPEFDLFESFGDFPDKVDSRTAHEFFERGKALADEKRFDEGIRNYELAEQLDPTFSPESTLKSQQASDQWRVNENSLCSKYLEDQQFDNAANVILALDERLKRDNDSKVLTLIRRLRHRSEVQSADLLNLGNEKDKAQAVVKYFGLLKEDDLTESLRIHISNKLMQLLATVDDRSRHERLAELIVNGVHPDVVNRFSEHYALKLMQDGYTMLEASKYDLAIEKFFWALLLPNQSRRRHELLRSALLALDRLFRSKRTIADCQSLKDPLFSELVVQITEQWNDEQDRQVDEKFRRLDDEPWILRKEIDELLSLLEKLNQRRPSTDHLVDKLRLPREREAQKLFGSIQEQLNLISQEGDHSKRKLVIQGDLRRLQKLAVDFAGGSRSTYSGQIKEFISKAEEYLLVADHKQFMNDLDLESAACNEKELFDLRNILTDEDDLKVLQAIGNTSRLLQETKFADQINELATHWFEKRVKSRFRTLTMNDPKQAREVLEASLSTLEKYKRVLSQELLGKFRTFVAEMLAEIDSVGQLSHAPEPMSTTPEPPPSPVPGRAQAATTGVLDKAIEWIRSWF